MAVLAITTGGTIGALAYDDPRQPPKYSRMPEEGRDLVREALQARFAATVSRCITMPARDSQLIDRSYREELLTIVRDSSDRAILITHGTDTLLKTADFFHDAFAAGNRYDGKAVVLTGAMTPLANGDSSDGFRNLGFAIDALDQGAPRGVSIVLSDFNDGGLWEPRLYRHRPGRYEKFYDQDGRYNRLREIPAAPQP